MVRIDTKRGRDSLKPRREPYWYKLSKGRFLGLRKLPDGHASWIARLRDDQGDQKYKYLNELSEAFDFDQAKRDAEHWFRDIDRGVSGRNDDGIVATVRTACIDYVRALRAEDRSEAAHDAHMRFRRTVYGDTADDELRLATATGNTPTSNSAAGKNPKARLEAHAISAIPLSKVQAARLKAWHVALVTDGLSKASANRTLTALKAALNLAVRQRKASPTVAQEWGDVVPLKGAAKRRDLFLDVTQRRALLANCSGALHDLLEATMHTGCRAGELTKARRSAFDARTKSLSVSGKTGNRTIPLTPAAVEIFTRLSRDKLPGAYLLTRDDGKPWAHSDWDELVRWAAGAAGLPAGTCLYTLRHCFITQALLDGMSTLEVARIVGTSLAMIEKHYGHLVENTARERLSRVQII